jgi:hypothetical protein
MLSRYYPGIHLYKLRKTIKYLSIASVPVKIRTGQHLNINIDYNRHIILLGTQMSEASKHILSLEDLNGRDHLQKEWKGE